LHFVTYAIINTPINCVWQDQLEAWFPSSTPAVVEKPTKESSEKPVAKKQGLNITNTLAKFILDQSVGALINIPLFIGVMGMLKGQNVDQIVNTVQEV
jgi:protein Mpv17